MTKSIVHTTRKNTHFGIYVWNTVCYYEYSANDIEWAVSIISITLFSNIVSVFLHADFVIIRVAITFEIWIVFLKLIQHYIKVYLAAGTERNYRIFCQTEQANGIIGIMTDLILH